MKKKFAVIGLGQFGTAIAKTLSTRNAEVIAIDKDIERVEYIKDFVSYTVCIDATNKEALIGQSIQDMDCVILAIGEDFHSAILCGNILIEFADHLTQFASIKKEIHNTKNEPIYKLKVFTRKNNKTAIYKLELPEIDLSEPLFNLIQYVGKSIRTNSNQIFKNNFNLDITKVLERI